MRFSTCLDDTTFSFRVFLQKSKLTAANATVIVSKAILLWFSWRCSLLFLMLGLVHLMDTMCMTALNYLLNNYVGTSCWYFLIDHLHSFLYIWILFPSDRLLSIHWTCKASLCSFQFVFTFWFCRKTRVSRPTVRRHQIVFIAHYMLISLMSVIKIWKIWSAFQFASMTKMALWYTFIRLVLEHQVTKSDNAITYISPIKLLYISNMTTNEVANIKEEVAQEQQPVQQNEDVPETQHEKLLE